MNLAPREKFGLGSKLKKFVRNIIPNEVADIAVKAAPFVAPFNPAIAGAMAGLGSFDQTGSISKGVKAGLINYGLGNVARVLGGAGPQFGFKAPGTGTGLGSYFTSPTSGTQLFGAKPTDVTTEALPGPDLDTYAGIEEYQLSQTDPKLSQIKVGADKVIEDIYGKGATTPGYKDLFSKVINPDATFSERTQAITDLGGKALKDIYTKPVTIDGKTEYQIDKLAVGATIAGATTYLEARKLAKEAELVDDEDQYTEEMYEADKARYKDYYSQILTPESFGLKDGGIISLRKMKANGDIPEEFISYTDDNSGVIYYDPEGNPITKAEAMKAFDEMPEEDQILTDMEGKPLGEPEVRKRILPMPKPKEFVFEGRMKRLMEAKGMLEPESFEYLLQELKDEMTESGIPSIKLEKKATGGRVGFNQGSLGGNTLFGDIAEIDWGKEIKDSGKSLIDLFSPSQIMDILKQAGEGFKQIYFNLKSDSEKEDLLKKIMGEDYEKKATGGRVGLKDGPGKDGLQNFKIGEYKPFKYTGSIDDVLEADLGDDPLTDIVKIGYTVRAPLIDIIRGVAKTGKEAASLIAAATKAGYDLTKPVRETVSDVAGGIYDVAKKTVQESGDASRFIQPLYYLERFAPEKNLTDDETRLRRLKRSIGRDDRDLIKTIENRIFGYDDAGINQSEEDKKVSKQIQADIDSRDFGFKKGGRIQYAMGSEVPIRQNEAGTKEMDFRQSGGFVPPIGIKEKADDIPAMLSNNEFVFTADAVRAAGGGSVNKGAQKMYALMKQLENKVV